MHIDTDSVSSVAGQVEKIADAMPEALSGAVDEVDAVMSGNGWSDLAGELRRGLSDFVESYDLLTRQVTGFGEDLRACVASWNETESAHAEVFARYGEDL
nr:hypothetical protein [Haloechinothrix aidingensis]